MYQATELPFQRKGQKHYCLGDLKLELDSMLRKLTILPWPPEGRARGTDCMRPNSLLPSLMSMTDIIQEAAGRPSVFSQHGGKKLVRCW